MALRIQGSTTIVTAVMIVLALIACSSDDAESTSSPDATFCGALTESYDKCAGASACGDALRVDCTKLASLLNPSVLTAATACIQATGCGKDPLTCVGKSLTALTPSAAQTKLATDFCASCASVGGDTCEKAFFGSGKVPGLGFALLPFGDAPIAAIDEACTSSSLGKVACQAAFSSCVSANASKVLAQSITVSSAKCLLTGIKDGLAGGGGGGADGGGGTDGGGGEGCEGCAGCCQDGTCQSGGDVAACGMAGASCETCGTGASCTAGACVTPCGPDNCVGCCDSGGQCQTAGAASACGSNGATCATCSGATSKCESGQCINPGCKASCASGCCSAAGCQPGGLAAACGTGGNACVDCGAGRTCGAGTCALDGASKWDFVLVGAHLPAANGTGGSWDGFGGLPDVYAQATSGATTGATAFVADTLNPVWNATVLADVTANSLKTEVKLDLSDDDVAFDDHVGLCSVKLNGTEFDGVLRTATCPKVGDDAAFTVDYRLKAR